MINSAVEQMIIEMKSHPFTLLIVLSLVGWSIYGSHQYAKAADISTVQADIRANNSKIDRVLKLQIAEAIRSINRQICGTEDRETIRSLRRTLDQLQQDYETINNGKAYEVQSCAA